MLSRAADRDDGFERSLHYRSMCVALTLWWLAYLYPLVTIHDIVGNLMSARESTSQGSIYNQALVVTLAAFGMVHFPRALRSLRSGQARTLATILVLYCFWSGLTIAWSPDRSLSARRLIAFLLLLGGCFGLGAGFYSRTRDGIATLARHVIYSAGICVCLLFALRFAEGDLMDVLNPQWTLKYTTQIEGYAFPIGYAIVAVVYVWREHPLRRYIVGALLFCVLILLKGRTLIIDVASATGITYSRFATNRLERVAAFLVGFGLTGILADSCSGART